MPRPVCMFSVLTDALGGKPDPFRNSPDGSCAEPTTLCVDKTLVNSQYKVLVPIQKWSQITIFAHTEDSQELFCMRFKIINSNRSYTCWSGHACQAAARAGLLPEARRPGSGGSPALAPGNTLINGAQSQQRPIWASKAGVLLWWVHGWRMQVRLLGQLMHTGTLRTLTAQQHRPAGL